MLEESALKSAGARGRVQQVIASHLMIKGIGTDEWSGNKEGSLDLGGASSSPQPASAPSLHIQPFCMLRMKPTIGTPSKGLCVLPMGSRAPILKSWSRTREFHMGRLSRRMTGDITEQRFTCITTT